MLGDAEDYMEPCIAFLAEALPSRSVALFVSGLLVESFAHLALAVTVGTTRGEAG
jgi:hypothetical protein